ncbi:MAG: hypothetical protein HC820_05515 [Hydrococcus sp. RM1_1_31]|nr:hypothetical protein [Hydrococcus sp. RM1_1_31]
MNDNALISLVLYLIGLGGSLLVLAHWRQFLISQWWIIPATAAWCVVSSILSTSDYFLLWWFGVALLLLLTEAFREYKDNFREYKSDRDSKTLIELS